MEQSRISDFNDEKEDFEEDWTFKTENTVYLTHGLHPYPARMIPQIASRLIRRYSEIDDLIWDPFCGSGTVLLECMLAERRSLGTDINPFAVFLSRVKTTPVNPKTVQKLGLEVLSVAKRDIENYVESPILKNIKNINYWYSKPVQFELASLFYSVRDLHDSLTRDFLLLCLASTARDVSYLKKDEYKIVRMKSEDMAKFKPNSFQTFSFHLTRCIRAMEPFFKKILKSRLELPRILEIDCRIAPLSDESVDLVITSPPYGDSQTTVAYGQYSRYPALWIGLNPAGVGSVDKRSLGGMNLDQSQIEICSTTFQKTHHVLRAKNEKRAKDLYKFVTELSQSMECIYKKLAPSGHACIVMGDRSMSRIRIPSVRILTELAGELGFSHIKTSKRSIPYKRIPRKIAPENIGGKTTQTILTESIIVLQKG